MRKLLLLIFLFLISDFAYSQMWYSGGSVANGGTITTCSGQIADHAGTSADYLANRDDIITICPSTAGDIIRLTFTDLQIQTGNGQSRDCSNDWLEIHHSDTYVAGGASDTYCGDPWPAGVPFPIIIATHPSGCITLRFKSNNSQQRRGFAATISCVTPCSNPTAQLTNTSTVNICPSTADNPGNLTVSFDASSSTTGTYTAPTSHSLVSYFWEWGDGTSEVTTSSTNTHSYSGEGIYIMKLRVRDDNYDILSGGCESSNSMTKVIRVLPAPSFTGSTTSPVTADCGGNVTLTSVARSQTRAETKPVITTGTVSLPDGNGQSYTSGANYSGLFPDGATVGPGCYPTVCFDLEHSWASDLTIDLVAPNGQTVRLYNRNRTSTAKHMFGRCAREQDDGVPGCPANYCVSPTSTNLWTNSANVTTTSQTCSVFAGPCETGNYFVGTTYASAQPFSNLNGAPLNGTWTLRITDNQSLDDGTLFGWSLSFPDACYRDLESVTPDIVNSVWSHSGTGPAVTSQDTTHLTVIDPGPDACPTAGTCIGNQITNVTSVGTFNFTGSYDYDVLITDEFGCNYSRTVQVNVTCTDCDVADVPVMDPVESVTVCPAGIVGPFNFTSTLPSTTVFNWSATNSAALGIPINGTGNISSFTALSNNTGADIVSTVTVTPVSNGCVGAPITFTITLRPSPSINDIQPITVCPGANIGPINFESMPEGASFSWITNNGSNIGLAASGTDNPILQYTAPLNNTGSPVIGLLIVTPTLNTCVGLADTVVITINPSPQIVGLQNVSACPGGFIQIAEFESNPSDATFSWVNSNTLIGLPASGNGNIEDYVSPENNTASPIAGTITVTASLEGCSGTGSFDITINNLPNAFAGDDDIILCGTTSLNLTGTSSTPGATFNWTTDDGNISTNTAQAGVTVTSSGTYVLTVTDPNTGCTVSDDVFIDEDPNAPEVTIGPSQSLNCYNENEGVVLRTTISNAGSNFTIEWKKSPDDDVIGTLDSLVVTAPGTYSITVINPDVPNCPTARFRTVLENKAQPDISVNTNEVLDCNAVNGQISLTGSSSVFQPDYLWTVVGTPGNIVSGATTTSPIVDQEGIYRLTVMNTINGCTNFADVTVTFDADYPLAFVGPDGSINCNSTSFTPNTSGSSSGTGFTYLWEVWSGGATIDDPSSLAQTFSEGGVYRLTVTSTSNGCIAYDTLTITEDNVVPVLNSTGNFVLNCYNNFSTQILVTATSGNSFSWTGPQNFSVLQPTVTIPGVYTLVVTNTNNFCVSNPLIVNVTMNSDKPDARVTPPDSVTCRTNASNPVLLDGSGSVGNNLQFTWKNSLGATISTNSTASVTQAGIYEFTVTDAVSGCDTTIFVRVELNSANPAVFVAVGGELDCITPTVNLTASVANASNVIYVWTGVSGTIVTDPNQSQITVNAGGFYNVYVENLGNGCISDSNVVFVKYTPGPTAGISASIISGDAPLDVDFTNTSSDYNSSLWFISGSQISGSTDYSHTFSNFGDFNVMLVVSNGLCNDTATVSISVFDNSTIVIPNVITPNGDNVNDVFKIEATNVETLDVKIFNRWGQKVYEWEGIQGSWAAKNFSGADVPEGTYFYILTYKFFNADPVVVRDFLTVIR
jgi:gliding motility-associated-like protein